MSNISLVYGATNYQWRTPADMEAWTRRAVANLLAFPGGPGQTVLTPVTVKPVTSQSAANPARAHLSVGQWVVGCPNDSHAYPATPGWPMLCVYCGNFDIDGDWRRVVFPDFLDELDAILRDRPSRLAQNWHGESLGLVRAEQAMGRDLTPDELRGLAFMLATTQGTITEEERRAFLGEGADADLDG